MNRLAAPWTRPGALYSAPGRFILKLELGEAPERIPTLHTAMALGLPVIERTGVGPVDRVLNHLCPHRRVTSVFAPAPSNRGASGGFDDVEHALGMSRTYRVETDPTVPIDDVVDALRQVGVVESATPQYLVTAPMSVMAEPVTAPQEPWAPWEQVRGVEAMAYEPGDPAVVVGVLDTGVVADHPELGANLRTGVDTVQLGSAHLGVGLRILGDTATPDTQPDDEVGHGTSCAAIIGGAGRNVAPGLAWGCGLVAARVLGSAGFEGRRDRIGVGAIDDIDAGMKWLVDLGAVVLNMSFGTPDGSLSANDPRPHTDVVQYALARGCVLVAASGNSGRPERYSPACLPGVIAVGSVDPEDRPSAFSTSGEHVHVAAPGERVATATRDGYGHVTGTSFASPFVAAAAALLVSRARRRAHVIAPGLIADVLGASARPWAAGTPDGHGAGILDVHTALALLDHRIDRGPPPGGGP